MVRTLVNLKEDIYKKLVELSIKKYGHARAISKVLNELLEEKLQKKTGWQVKVTVKINKNLDFSPKKIKELASDAWTE